MPPAASDQDDLGRFGYAQELFRSMGGFSNFAISFSIISILTGAVTLYGYGLEMGGPLEMTLGWPLATLFTLTVAASMAELCSAYPTAGAMYHWAADLGGRGAGWYVAWLIWVPPSIVALSCLRRARRRRPIVDKRQCSAHVCPMRNQISL